MINFFHTLGIYTEAWNVWQTNNLRVSQIIEMQKITTDEPAETTVKPCNPWEQSPMEQQAIGYKEVRYKKKSAFWRYWKTVVIVRCLLLRGDLWWRFHRSLFPVLMSFAFPLPYLGGYANITNTNFINS